MLLYVGIENALGGWLPTHAHRTLSLGLGGEVASSIALCFWIGELGGRGLTTLMLNLVTERMLYRACIMLLLTAMSAICFAQHLTRFGLFTLVIISAVSLAPLYPLIVSFLVARAGSQPRLGPLFALSALGGAFLPWLTGVVSTHFHALRVGLAVPATGALLLLLLSTGLPRSSGEEPTLSR
jgi:fucose permease